MINSFTQLFANPQLNSSLLETMSAEGKLLRRIPYRSRTDAPLQLYLLDDNRLLVDDNSKLCVVNLASGTEINSAARWNNSPVIISPQRDIVFCKSRLFKMDFNLSPSTKSFFIPHFGDNSRLDMMIVRSDEYIAGVQMFPTPVKDETPYYLMCMPMEPSSSWKWAHQFDDTVVAVPTTVEGGMAVLHGMAVTTISSRGGISANHEFKSRFLTGSIGPDGLLYFLWHNDGSVEAGAMNLSTFTVVWSHPVDIRKPVMPPLVNKKRKTFFIDSFRILCVSDEKNLWTFTRNDTSGILNASLTSSGSCIVVCGQHLMSLDENGTIKWTFKTPDEIIVTQPILDSKGRVIVAGYNNIYVIE